MLDEILDGPAKPKVIEVPVEDEVQAERPAEAKEPAKRDQLPSGRAWDPVPVPLPTYVTKPAAPQRQPAALPTSSTAPRGSGTSTGPTAGAPGRASGSGAVLPPSVPVSGSARVGADPVA